jgi:DNA integrity scanning protein DisA with diadenylate cyclase activity
MGKQEKQKQSEPIRSDADLARIIAQVAQSVPADAVICGTETGSLFRLVQEATGGLRLIAATPNGDTHDALTREGFDVLRLSVRVAHKYSQVRYAVSMALNTGKVSAGDLVVCAVGHNLCHGSGDLILVTDVETSAADVALSDLVKLTDGIRPNTLEAALQVACKIGRIARRGKRVGVILVLGDSDEVLQGSKQLILNPFHGHEDADRMLTSPDIHEMLIELAKLDGAFIVRGDGFIRTAGAFLAVSAVDFAVPAGLGARHVAAAAATARTGATAVVVSSTDGHVRAFSGGELVLQLDPDVPLTPLLKDIQA